MLKREKPEEQINHDRWLVSYSDFITLLFAFFVVMYSVSQVNDGKYRVLSDSLKENFKGSLEQLSKKSGITGDLDLAEQKTLVTEQEGEITRSENAEDSELYENHSAFIMGKGGYGPAQQKDLDILEDIGVQLASAFSELMQEDQITLKSYGEWLELELSSSILFASGDTKPSVTAESIFADVAFILKEYNNEIRVEGFTDDQPINSQQFPSNWELSSARAVTVVKLLAQHGVDPGRMSAVGYSEYRPIGDNGTEQGRAKNRRVVVVISRRPMEKPTPDVVGNIDEKQLLEEIDKPLIKFEWEDEKPKPEKKPVEIEGVKTIQLKDGGLRFTNQPREKQKAAE